MRGRQAVLWTVPLIYFVFVAAEFAAMTHLALVATAEGRSALAVGLLAAALWLGILLASARSHAAVQRHGHARVFVAATALATLAMASFALHERYALWCGGAFVLGFAGGFVWVAGEAWLAEAAPSERRGFYVGWFETAVGLGLMAGPALVPLTRQLGWPTLASAALLMAASLVASLPLVRVPRLAADEDPGLGAAAVPAVDWRRIALPLVGVALLGGVMESGVSALMPSLALRLGFGFDAAALLGTVIGAGSALLQPPAGHLADRIGVRRATLAAWVAVLAATLALLVFAAHPDPLLWIVGFTLGGVGGAVYTLMIVELGHRLAGSALVKSIALLVSAYSVGTTVGPLVGGAMFDAAALRGLAGLLVVLAVVGWLFTLRAVHSPTARSRVGAGTGVRDDP